MVALASESSAVHELTVQGPTPPVRAIKQPAEHDGHHLSPRNTASDPSLSSRNPSILLCEAPMMRSPAHSGSTASEKLFTPSDGPVAAPAAAPTTVLVCSSYSDDGEGDGPNTSIGSRETTKRAWYPDGHPPLAKSKFARSGFCTDPADIPLMRRDQQKLGIPVTSLRTQEELDEQDRAMLVGLPSLKHKPQVPEGWDEMVAPLGATWLDDIFLMGFVGHCMWVALAATSLVFAALAWKVFVWAPDGSAGLEAQYADSILSLGAGALCCVKIASDLFPRVLSVPTWSVFGVWALLAVVYVLVGVTHKSSPIDVGFSLTLVVFLAGSSAGLFYAGDEGGSCMKLCLRIVFPCWVVIVTVLILLLAVLPSVEDLSHYALFGVRLGIGVLSILPVISCQYCLAGYYESVHSTLPTRSYHSVTAVVVSLPAKLISFALPVWLSVLAEGLRGAGFITLASVAPKQLQRVRERRVHPTSGDVCDQEEGARYQLAHTVLASILVDMTSSMMAAFLYPMLRFKLGYSLEIGWMVLHLMAVLALSAVASAIGVALLHHLHRVPVSSVYWLYSKEDHCFVMTVGALLSLVAWGTPTVFRICSTFDGMKA
eukprot:TRINITY_DN24770_c0_g1_i1.p1 TRINITY_DN24770_c0_g1~~TRINITY_DN24770_c0_g1_i1.p1  ORF type:complete len:599 (+),score=122.93 TRINITY_DN24770_c0_g1_i1:133-1929(+)